MKNLLIVFCAIFIATGALCQVTKSNWMLNGEIGYQNLKEDGASESVSIVTFNPKIGYLITNSFMLGADFNVMSVKTSDYTYTQSLMGPFARIYSPMGEGKNVSFFGEGIYSFGSDQSKYQGDKEKDSKSAWALGAGIAAFLGENVSIEPLIRYQSIKTKYEETQYSPASEDKLGSFEFLIGISLYLGGKSE